MAEWADLVFKDSEGMGEGLFGGAKGLPEYAYIPYGGRMFDSSYHRRIRKYPGRVRLVLSYCRRSR